MLQVEVVMKHTTLWSLLLAALVVGVLPACSAGPTARPQPASGDDDDSEDDCACSNSNFLTQSACEAAGHTWSCGGDDDTSGDDDAADDDDFGDDDAADDDDFAGDDDAADDDDFAGDDDAADDDDFGDDDTGGSGGSAPSVQSIEVCEQPNPQQTVPGCVAPECFYGQFNISVVDSDGDLQNPSVSMAVMGGSPQNTPINADMSTGGTLALLAPAEWPRGTDVSYSISITDAAGNQSQLYQDSWSVPASIGMDDCPQ